MNESTPNSTTNQPISGLTIHTKNLSKRFNREWIFRDLTYEFKSGNIYAITGPNGSGKTTLIKTILGLVKQDAGTIYFDGVPIRNDVTYRKNIGYMPQIGRFLTT